MLAMRLKIKDTPVHRTKVLSKENVQFVATAINQQMTTLFHVEIDGWSDNTDRTWLMRAE